MNGGRASTNDGNLLVTQFVEPAIRTTAGIVVVPATGVERVAFKVADTRDTRQLWTMQWTVGHGHKPGLDSITSVG